MSYIVPCSECGLPWGVLEPENFVIPDGWPHATVTAAVLVTDADASFIADRGAECLDGGLWYFTHDLIELGAPAWWVTAPRRKPQAALRFPSHRCGDIEMFPSWDHDAQVVTA